ncbi:MAG: hypothetical protein K8H74_11805 [Notoacmeibacter sp.]|nr:hypothetical protein [Notoacmeibacter sp.]
MAKDAENQGNTVAEMIDLDMEATAFSHACSRYRPLDLAALSKTRGPDMPIRRVALRLCENCGARDCGVLLRKATREERWN